MKTYQTLTLIGGIFGIIVFLICLFFMALIITYFSAFIETHNINPKTLGEFAYYMIISTIISIVGIIIVFTCNNTKNVGYALLGLSFMILIASSIIGIPTCVLFLVGGIFAIRSKVETVDQNQVKKSDVSSLEILKERYAKGEISTEEYDKIKDNLKD